MTWCIGDGALKNLAIRKVGKVKGASTATTVKMYVMISIKQ